jgi:hypothetical protein
MTSNEAKAFFAKWGYLRVPGAFNESDSLRMQEWMWRRMQQVHGVERDNLATWNVDWPGTHITEQQSGLSPARMATPAFKAAADAVLGADAWRLPKEWSGALISFPRQDGASWNVVADGWHWDSEVAAHLHGPRSLFIFGVFSPIEPQGGGTLLLAGSHHLLHRFFAAMTPAQQAGKRKGQREQFSRSSPYLATLTGKTPFDGDRVAHFMAEAEDNGVAVQVVEVTGQPGDAWVCHPSLFHAVSLNCRTVPRLMRITQATRITTT